MGLDLDDRQRAMLQEMGVHVWLPPAQAPQADAPLTPRPGVGAASPERDAAAPRIEPVTEQVAQPELDGYPNGDAPSGPGTDGGKPPVLQGFDGTQLRVAADACSACGLCGGRKHTTLHMPDPPAQADWLVLGDPPDEDEDRLGQPFVEQTGLLLDNMLKAVGASRTGKGRQGAYLSNVVKCRPPLGRVPQATDLAQCAQYLQREIELVQPKLILAMGRFATQLLLQEHPEEAALPLGKQRGQVYRYRGIPVVVTYHPKVLLRASADKAKAWADLCLGLEVLDASLQSRP